MSPLLQKQRTGTVPAAEPSDQHWSMLLFESCSAGVLAIAVGIASVMLVVSLYLVLVWPLTLWDLANLGLEKYAQYGDTALWSVFAGGTLAGYWCFSGKAFKKRRKSAPKSVVQPTRARR